MKRKHVLVCEEHKLSIENRELLDEYKNKCILNSSEKDKLPEFSSQISFHSKSDLHHTDMSSTGNGGNFEDIYCKITVS